MYCTKKCYLIKVGSSSRCVARQKKIKNSGDYGVTKGELRNIYEIFQQRIYMKSFTREKKSSDTSAVCAQLLL